MQIKLKIDYAEFSQALAQYAAATGKDAADVVNRARDNILIKSRYSLVKLTPKATPKRIESDLRKDNILAKMASKTLGVGHTKGERQKWMRKKMGKRKSSSAYAISGWIAAARKAGIQKGTRSKQGSFSYANTAGLVGNRRLNPNNGSSTTASAANAESIIENFTEAAKHVGSQALQDSVNLAAADMKEYAMKKLEQRAKQYSAR